NIVSAIALNCGRSKSSSVVMPLFLMGRSFLGLITGIRTVGTVGIDRERDFVTPPEDTVLEKSPAGIDSISSVRAVVKSASGMIGREELRGFVMTTSSASISTGAVAEEMGV